jgi:hypothetical protein
MILTGTAGVRLAMTAALTLLMAGEWAAISQAAKPSRSDAMDACRAKYGKKVTNIVINENGTFACQWHVMRSMTHAEAYEACRKKFDAITAFVHKTKAGWRCRYRPRY